MVAEDAGPVWPAEEEVAAVPDDEAVEEVAEEIEEEVVDAGDDE